MANTQFAGSLVERAVEIMSTPLTALATDVCEQAVEAVTNAAVAEITNTAQDLVVANPGGLPVPKLVLGGAVIGALCVVAGFVLGKWCSTPVVINNFGPVGHVTGSNLQIGTGLRGDDTDQTQNGPQN